MIKLTLCVRLAVAVIMATMACARSESRVEPTDGRRGPTAAAGVPAPLVREAITVRRAGRDERWSLEWRSAPRPACAPADPAATTCPCEGFAYGEMGVLDLVRRRAGRPDERLALSPMFANAESPADSGLAVLQRWPVLDADYTAGDTATLAARVRQRVAARVIRLGDYDHDGAATELPIQIGTAPCGKRMMIVVGVSRADSSLHAFTSVAHPERPLVLEDRVWRQLRRSRAVRAVEWACGDHASGQQTEVQLSVNAQRIDGWRSTYECRPNGSPGRKISSERI